MSAINHVAIGAAPKVRSLPQQPLHVAQLEDALLRLRTVAAITGLGRSSIYAKVYEGTFPQPVRMGARCSRWRSAEVTAWLQAQGKEG